LKLHHLYYMHNDGGEPRGRVFSRLGRERAKMKLKEGENVKMKGGSSDGSVSNTRDREKCR